jgi:hypothetical protein
LISESNLWVMLHRARMALRECLAMNWFENPEVQHNRRRLRRKALNRSERTPERSAATIEVALSSAPVSVGHASGKDLASTEEGEER